MNIIVYLVILLMAFIGYFQVFLKMFLFLLINKYLEMDLLDRRVDTCSVSKEITKQFFEIVVLVCVCLAGRVACGNGTRGLVPAR